VNFLAAKLRDDLLAKLTQADAGPRQVGVSRNQSKDVSLGRRHVPAQQEVRRTKVKEAQRMALDDLAEVHEAAQFIRRRRNVNGHDGIPGLGGGQQMADRTNAADACRDAGHFCVRAALAKLLEAAELDDVELGVRDIAGVVQKDADLGVALDTGHGVNDDALSHNLIQI